MAQPFARAPGDINQGDHLDYTTRAGYAVYESSIKSLYPATEQCFDLSADGLTLFMNKLNDRAMEFGWSENVLVMDDDLDHIGEGGPGTHFMDAHGGFALEHIQQVERFCDAEESRTSQNSHMLSKAILASLTPEAVNRVNMRREDWVLSIQVEGAADEVDLACGVCLLKVVLIVSQQEITSTIAHVIAQFNNLNPLMEEVDYNIQLFNERVDALANKLIRSDKEVPETVMMSLFTAFLSVPDKDFHRYIEKKHDDFSDGELEITHKVLMQNAETKHFDLVNNKRTWRTLSEEDKKLAALSAELDSLKKKVKKGSTSSTPSTATRPGNRSGKSTGDDQGDAKPTKPDWWVKQIKPRSLNSTRTWNGKTWRWCCPETGGKCEGKWVTHPANKCEGKNFRFKVRRDPGGGRQRGANKRQKSDQTAHEATVNQQLQAALADAKDECQDEVDSEH